MFQNSIVEYATGLIHDGLSHVVVTSRSCHTSHVVSCDCEVLHGCPNEFKAFFKYGAKHRPDGDSVVKSSIMRQQMLVDISVALSIYAKAMLQQYDVSAWCGNVKNMSAKQLETHRCNDSLSFGSSAKPHEPGSELLPYLSMYDTYIKRIQEQFDITTAKTLLLPQQKN